MHTGPPDMGERQGGSPLRKQKKKMLPHLVFQMVENRGFEERVSNYAINKGKSEHKYS